MTSRALVILVALGLVFGLAADAATRTLDHERPPMRDDILDDIRELQGRVTDLEIATRVTQLENIGRTGTSFTNYNFSGFDYEDIAPGGNPIDAEVEVGPSGRVLVILTGVVRTTGAAQQVFVTLKDDAGFVFGDNDGILSESPYGVTATAAVIVDFIDEGTYHLTAVGRVYPPGETAVMDDVRLLMVPL